MNGYRVDGIESCTLVHKAIGINRAGFSIPISIYPNNDIKTIVTNEQFKNAEYRVEEE